MADMTDRTTRIGAEMSEAMAGGAPADRLADTVTVAAAVVACDGDGALGHPRVYLNFGDAATIDCPYCGRRFVRAASGQHTGP
jgi:uncharacterized Zn-finger protein